MNTSHYTTWTPPPPFGPPPEFQALAQARHALADVDWTALANRATTDRARRIAFAAAELVRAIDEGEFPWWEAL